MIDDNVIVLYFETIYIYIYICEAVFIGEIVVNVWDDDLLTVLCCLARGK